MTQKVTEKVSKAIGAVIQSAFFFGEVVMQKLGWCAKIKAKFGRDPMKCDNCGEELILWKIWCSTHGLIYYFPDDSPNYVEPNSLPKLPVTVQLSFSF